MQHIQTHCHFLVFVFAVSFLHDGIGIKEAFRIIQDTRRDRGVIDLDKQTGSKNLPLKRGFVGYLQNKLIVFV